MLPPGSTVPMSQGPGWYRTPSGEKDESGRDKRGAGSSWSWLWLGRSPLLITACAYDYAVD